MATSSGGTLINGLMDPNIVGNPSMPRAVNNLSPNLANNALTPDPNSLVPTQFTFPPGGGGTNEYRPTIAQAQAQSAGLDYTTNPDGSQTPLPGTGKQGAGDTRNAWAPGSSTPITAQQVISQYGADPSVAQYWADKINNGGDAQYYISRLQKDNTGSGIDAKGGMDSGGDPGAAAAQPNGIALNGSGSGGANSFGNIMSMMMGPMSAGYQFGASGGQDTSGTTPFQNTGITGSSNLSDYSYTPVQGLSTIPSTLSGGITPPSAGGGPQTPTQMSSSLMQQLLTKVNPASSNLQS